MEPPSLPSQDPDLRRSGKKLQPGHLYTSARDTRAVTPVRRPLREPPPLPSVEKLFDKRTRKRVVKTLEKALSKDLDGDGYLAEECPVAAATGETEGLVNPDPRLKEEEEEEEDWKPQPREVRCGTLRAKVLHWLHGYVVGKVRWIVVLDLLKRVAVPVLDAWKDWAMTYRLMGSQNPAWFTMSLMIQFIAGTFQGLILWFVKSSGEEWKKCSDLAEESGGGLRLAVSMVAGLAGVAPAAFPYLAFQEMRHKSHWTEDQVDVAMESSSNFMKIIASVELMLETLPQSMLQLYVLLTHNGLQLSVVQEQMSQDDDQGWDFWLVMSVSFGLFSAGRTLYNLEDTARIALLDLDRSPPTFSAFSISTHLMWIAVIASLVSSVAMFGCAFGGYAAFAAVGVMVAMTVYVWKLSRALVQEDDTDSRQEFFSRNVRGRWFGCYLLLILAMVALLNIVEHQRNDLASLHVSGQSGHFDCKEIGAGWWMFSHLWKFAIVMFVMSVLTDTYYGLSCYRRPPYHQQLGIDEAEMVIRAEQQSGHSESILSIQDQLFKKKVQALWEWADPINDGVIKDAEFCRLCQQVGHVSLGLSPDEEITLNGKSERIGERMHDYKTERVHLLIHNRRREQKIPDVEWDAFKSACALEWGSPEWREILQQDNCGTDVLPNDEKLLQEAAEVKAEAMLQKLEEDRALADRVSLYTTATVEEFDKLAKDENLSSEHMQEFEELKKWPVVSERNEKMTDLIVKHRASQRTKSPDLERPAPPRRIGEMWFEDLKLSLNANSQSLGGQLQRTMVSCGLAR